MSWDYAHDGAQRRGDSWAAGLPLATGLRAVQSAILALGLILAGCSRSDQEIKLYRVAKPSLDSTTAPDDGPPPDAAAVGFLNGVVPPNWEPQPLSQMRQASFLVHGENGAVADISFVTLGPSAGNLLDNVNRWLSQLAQPPMTNEKLGSAVQQIASAAGDIAVVDLSGEPENGDAKKDGRIIAAIASDARGTSFYKMRGNQELAGKEKENFLKWVRTSRDGNVPTAAADAVSAPDESSTPQIKWDLPADWTPGASSAMRYASFTVGENSEKADISVITFPGDGGNDLDNVNRWRQQIGLPAIDAAGLNAMVSPISANEVGFSTVDLAGATAPDDRRMDPA